MTVFFWWCRCLLVYDSKRQHVEWRSSSGFLHHLQWPTWCTHWSNSNKDQHSMLSTTFTNIKSTFWLVQTRRRPTARCIPPSTDTASSCTQPVDLLIDRILFSSWSATKMSGSSEKEWNVFSWMNVFSWLIAIQHCQQEHGGMLKAGWEMDKKISKYTAVATLLLDYWLLPVSSNFWQKKYQIEIPVPSVTILVGLAFFDSAVSAQVKSAMVKVLGKKTTDHPQHIAFNPTVRQKQCPTSYHNTPKQLFTALNIPQQFLMNSPDTRSSDNGSFHVLDYWDKRQRLNSLTLVWDRCRV